MSSGLTSLLPLRWAVGCGVRWYWEASVAVPNCGCQVPRCCPWCGMRDSWNETPRLIRRGSISDVPEYVAIWQCGACPNRWEVPLPLALSIGYDLALCGAS